MVDPIDNEVTEESENEKSRYKAEILIVRYVQSGPSESVRCLFLNKTM